MNGRRFKSNPISFFPIDAGRGLQDMQCFAENKGIDAREVVDHTKIGRGRLEMVKRWSIAA